MKPITESLIESFSIELLQYLGWDYMHGLAIASSTENNSKKIILYSLIITIHFI